jgi:hypothetical protein
MTAQSIRFVYTDSNGDQQTVASTLGQGAEINRVRQNRNFRDTNKVKVWGGSKMFNAFPQQISGFQGPEPEIFMEEKVNGSFETVARVYSKGSGDIKDKESVCVTLYGFQRYVEDQQVNISNTTTDIVDVAEKLANEIDGSYVIEAPDEVDVSGGYPSVDGYSYSGKADRVIQELTRDYNFNLLFTDRTDNNGNNVIRFEPEGFGGAVDTLDSNTTGLVFDNWEKERTENIVNKVEVDAVNSNGNNVTGTASNQDMIDKYGVKFERVQLQFVESLSEADLIAEERLKPGKDSNGNDITTPPEGGVVNLPTNTFRQGIENDSVNVVDNELNIDDTFTVSKHKLFYPSGRSELHLDFEDEKLEERAAKDKYLGDRNSELITDTQTDVGGQNVNGNTEDVNDQYDSHSAAQGDHDVSGQTFTETTDDTESNEGRATFSNVSDGFVASLEINTDFVSGETDVAFIEATVSVEENTASTPGYDLKIENNDNGNVYFDEDNFIKGDAIAINGVITASTLVVVGDNLEGDQVDFEVANNTGSDKDIEISGSVAQLSDFSINQPSQPDGADPRSDGSTNTTNSSDSSAGDTTSLDTDGSTDTKNVNVAEEDKVNR